MEYQVPYHNLNIPLNPPVEPAPYSSLHLLYPGMPMIANDLYDRYYIPHACPEQARAAFLRNKANTVEAAAFTENLARCGAITEDHVHSHHPIAINDGIEIKPKPKRRRKLREHFSTTKASKNGDYSYVLYIIIALIFLALIGCLIFMKF